MPSDFGVFQTGQRHGHRAARLDPLDLASRPNVPALDPRRYGFKLDEAHVRSDFRSSTLPEGPAADAKAIDTRGILDLPVQDVKAKPTGKNGSKHATTKSIEYISKWLAEVYCEGVAYEFMHMPAKFERRFLEQLLESSHAKPITQEQQLAQWRLLAASETFDAWAAKRFPNVKRYGLEGAEGMMVAISQVMNEVAQQGVEEVVIAMPHRGRLNLLTQLLDLDMRLLVRKMRGQPTLPASLPSDQFTDDVLSHLFLSTEYQPPSDTSVKVHLLPNPSHLEAVSPVGLGFARGLQVPFGSLQASDKGEPYELGQKVLSLQVHGDAAFGGQGIVQETLNLSNLPNFTVGGSIRIVVNNQLGYTTPASTGRSSLYASELAKSISAPIVHVNGDRIDDVARAVSLAVAYRNKFKKDVIIDLVVYRRRGHNELDEPSYTSPVMYQAIEKLPSVAKIYEQQLVSSGLLTADQAQQERDAVFKKLDESLTAAEPDNFKVPELKRERGWDKTRWPNEGEWEQDVETGVDTNLLKEIGLRSVTVPEDITPHPRLKRMHISKRIKSLETGEGIDFATAEALAFGSLVVQGQHVRLCGQDSGRGTFSQRHAVISDQSSTRTTVPLQTLTSNPPTVARSDISAGTFEVVNSPLSEYAVVGFEQGFAWVSPKVLPLWEAQAMALDTFLGSCETKWALQSALTLLLPHGYEGAGPEHSSARIERFLQLTNEPMSRSEAFVPNMHLVQPTTASNYFHVLRRQMARDYRKPLVVFSPKGILRLPAASSKLDEMAPSTTFQPVLAEPVITTSNLERVVFVSGKIYYDLTARRKELNLQDKVTFIRVEEISPFPYNKLEHYLQELHDETGRSLDVVWAQDEPENAGAWTFVGPRLKQVVEAVRSGDANVRYVGRKAMSTPAPGVGEYYRKSRDEVWAQVFEGL
ncbi:putative 2-oxoglutarate dehydrogenase E1 component DHKTD1, mitochondrial [Microbotryomycetes sp. JL201]|nr:putative 2-oxoglutarate dehydrogenase E1 component DHKTD1, mitochondrial [Microbotryomycetes sp. JL201]